MQISTADIFSLGKVQVLARYVAFLERWFSHYLRTSISPVFRKTG
jgi:hypothetical protein